MIIVTQTRKVKRYGARKDTPDLRDRVATFTKAQKRAAAVAKTVRLVKSPNMPPVVDQDFLGACVGNSSATSFRFQLREQRLTDYQPSRLAIYYGARKIEGNADFDAGCEIRDAMKVLAKEGAGDETLWPYDISRFTEQPSDAYYQHANAHQIIVYERVEQTQAAIQAAIHGRDLITFGFAVYESFESAKVEATGTVPMPKSSEALLGWHAVAMHGYDPRRTDNRNSWGEPWGRYGNFTLKWDYVLNPDLANDFWRIRVVEAPKVTEQRRGA
jgi:C1A family cysteine protease